MLATVFSVRFRAVVTESCVPFLEFPLQPVVGVCFELQIFLNELERRVTRVC